MSRYRLREYYLILATIFFALGETRSADWGNLPIPAHAPEGLTWNLHPVSDDFSYEAASDEAPPEFSKRWKSEFINRWTGPGGTLRSAGHRYVTNGHLAITATRQQDSRKVLAGIVSSKAELTYPVFVEARAKVSNQVLASCVWMLSEDSTEEIDIIEAYGSDRPGQEWYAERMHLSHHVFIREPFQDYQPTDDGTWFTDDTNWREGFRRVGVYWRDPWHLEYYIDGELVRTASGKEVIDPLDFTEGKGLTKPMRIIINTEDQDWRIEQGVTPTDEELADNDRNIFWIDWIRAYEAR
ncbi:MAG: family 16 glycosylhydrolase [Verrucomicrobiota bacterium]